MRCTFTWLSFGSRAGWSVPPAKRCQRREQQPVDEFVVRHHHPTNHDQTRVLETSKHLLTFTDQGLDVVSVVGGGQGGESPVEARNPSMSCGRYWMRLRRFFAVRARSVMVPAARFARLRRVFDHTFSELPPVGRTPEVWGQRS